MKKSGFTFVFVIICIGVLVAAYGVGVCIREIRFRDAQEETEVSAKVDKPGTETKPEGTVQKPTPPAGDQEPEDGPPPQRMGGPGGAPGMPTREQLENMSEEERQAAMAKMRERFGSRRREGGPELSEEDRAKFREEMEALREKWEGMSDEEKKKVEAEFTEKYGFFPNPDRRRPGGGFGGARGGGRRRSRPDEGQ
ncbi:hypothetical protein ACFL5Z_13775 [Planctomycetota bacterium]